MYVHAHVWTCILIQYSTIRVHRIVLPYKGTTHSHSNDSKAQDLLLGVLLSLPLNFVTLGKVIPNSPPDLHVQDARLVET